MARLVERRWNAGICTVRSVENSTRPRAAQAGTRFILSRTKGTPMQSIFRRDRPLRRVAIAAALALAAGHAAADAITDWNQKSNELIAEAKLGTPPAVRVMAIVQTAAYDAATAAAGRPPGGRRAADPASATAIDAAIAAAHRTTLLKLMPAQQPGIDTAYQAALARLAEGPAKTAGLAAGEQAATAVLAQRSDDGAASAETYRPHTTAGVYVPTATPAATQWQKRKPWLMTSPAQFRPAAPPALTSSAWAAEYNEVRAMGGRAGSRRSAEQTEVARFWEYSLPAIYHGVVQSVALSPGRDVIRNARLYAAMAQAMDDALISVFEAKYHYQFWRPVTAIRNGDIDGNDATVAEAGWTPLIDVPMHPEYPSGHAILAASVGAVLKADIGNAPMPVLSTSSPSAKGAVRRWNSVDEFVREVVDARVWGGLHYRFSSEAGVAMGSRIGELAAAKHLGL